MCANATQLPIVGSRERERCAGGDVHSPLGHFITKETNVARGLLVLSPLVQSNLTTGQVDQNQSHAHSVTQVFSIERVSHV